MAMDAPTSKSAIQATEASHHENLSSLKAHAISPDHQDIGLEYYLQALQLEPAERDRIAARVLKKIDYALLPFMCITFLLSFLDKLTLNYADAYGLRKDLKLVGNQYSWIVSVTNIGYLVGAYPSNYCLQKLPIGKFMSAMIVTWGILLVATVGAQNFTVLMVLRFLLGMFESCMGPAWIVLTSMFWTRKEQPLRMCIWMGSNGIAQMGGVGISWGLGHTHNQHLSSWQLIFLTVGVIAITNGIAAFFFLPSTPVDFKLFSKEERAVSVWRIRDNQTGIKNNKILTYQIKEALLEPRVWLIAAQQLAIGVCNAGVSNFMSAMFKGFGYDTISVILYQLPNGAFQLFSTVLAGYIVSRVPNSTIITTLVVYLPALVGVIGIATISLEHRLTLTACCWIMNVSGAAIILNWSGVAANFSGNTKRMTVNGLNFVCYAGGNIIGPFMYMPSEAPRYLSAIKSLVGVYAALLAITASIGAIMWRSNRQRDSEVRSGNVEVLTADTQAEVGFLDLTDRENPSFRYKL